LALLLRTWNVRRLYSSDLLRALQTAQTLAKSWDVPITARSELREISFGDWEGRRWSEIRTAAPEMKALESSPDLCAPGGERFATFRCRTLRALREALDETDEQLVAVVTHLGVMRVVLNEMISRDRPWELPQRIDHCSVYRIRAMGTTLKLLGELKIKA
jgi:alpha-ribazole phosphatase